MNYYFIYSAGGGAGDWNGVKRIWTNSMPVSIKSHILLKFGDIFLNHACGQNLLRPQRCSSIKNLREWLSSNTNDTTILSDYDILLDSGTAKIVSWINHNYNSISCNDLIDVFDRILFENNILDHYMEIVINSDITSAVTFDIPNPFKIRSQSANTRLNILEKESSTKLVDASAKYSNYLYNNLPNSKADDILMTIINGTWTDKEISLFLEKLSYTPKKIAIGGLSNINNPEVFSSYVSTLKSFDLEKYCQVHFLGCGGIKKVNCLKSLGYSNNNFSVDCSTVINRTIDGNLKGTRQSCYYVYDSMEMIRIKPTTKDRILELHSQTTSPYFSNKEMEEIINLILQHQNNNSSLITYDARARLLVHNSDVYRKFANQ